MNKALGYINQLSKTGVDAIKFQTHIASEESTLNEPFRVKLKNLKVDFAIGNQQNLLQMNGEKFQIIVKEKNYFFKLTVF